MPATTELKSVLVIGSGPIVIGQACEFDYSGTQACLALKEAGYRVILINANPASVMTDSPISDAVYLQPLTVEWVVDVIQREKPDAILPTMAGQTGLNMAMALHHQGLLAKYGLTIIGAWPGSIELADDRQCFKRLVHQLGLSTPRSIAADTMAQAEQALENWRLPLIIRPCYTLGGYGGGVAYTPKQFRSICAKALQASTSGKIQIEQCMNGHKEFELELIRDRQDNVIVVCSMENLDPVGVHTGDSVTVAPAQTLTDPEYQAMRKAAIAIMRKVEVDTGGANIQFAVNPENGELSVIEMNPRVSRSSALASKATGYPIARVAALLAVGHTLDELTNELTGSQIPAAFEPVQDYVTTKIPCFNDDKFPTVCQRLGSSMRSIGEIMALGRCFQESLQKALMALELEPSERRYQTVFDLTARPYRLLTVMDAFRQGRTLAWIHQQSGIDCWFLAQIEELIACEKRLIHSNLQCLDRPKLKHLKRLGFSDGRLAEILNTDPSRIRQRRRQLGIKPGLNIVDTCAGEFDAATDYIYTTYGAGPHSPASTHNRKLLLLGSGPNRVGQGIEFDYCCVRATRALRQLGFETVMINCNPETVSTDYNTADRLYFEPVVAERVLDIIEHEKPWGVIIQFGGQTSLKLADILQRHDVLVLGSNAHTVRLTENRHEFQLLLQRLAIAQPANKVVHNRTDALSAAHTIGLPVILRPSYVLSGQGMQIVHNDKQLTETLRQITIDSEHPLLVERFLDNAIELEADAVSDGNDAVICGLMEHVEPAGVHSGDSACVLPTLTVSDELVGLIKSKIKTLIENLGHVGLVNVQLAVWQGRIYMLELNPRASRTVPFVCKATGIPWVDIAIRCLLGESLQAQAMKEPTMERCYVKEAILPFDKLSGQSPRLGPQMQATGEVMGQSDHWADAYKKAQLAAGFYWPQAGSGQSVCLCQPKPEENWQAFVNQLESQGFQVYQCHVKDKILSGLSFLCPTLDKQLVLSLLDNGSISWVIDITSHNEDKDDEILQQAILKRVYYTTTRRATRLTLASIAYEPAPELI